MGIPVIPFVPWHVLFLRSELLRRQAKNRSYSLRAFAQNLLLHPSALSRILNCRKELSLSACIALVPKIDFTEQEKHDFLLSVSEERMHRAAHVLARALQTEIRLAERIIASSG